jgi:hypothetical protein
MRKCVIPSAHLLLEIRENYQLPISQQERRWEYVHYLPDAVGIVRSQNPGILFRGQNQRYRPSLSSLARGITPNEKLMSALPFRDQARLIERIVRRVWFLREWQRHPASKWFKTQRIHGFEMPLAQHYEIPTGYIDLTESFDVACFFATCFKDKNDGIWCPCTEGTGVIYKLPIDGLPVRPDALQPIGLQPFPRPREQWGWVIVTGVVGLGNDFEEVRRLEPVEFQHEKEVSKYFLNKFNKGVDLFPPDDLAQIATEILRSDILPTSVLDRTLQDLRSDPRGVSIGDKELHEILTFEFGVCVGEVPELLTSEKIDELEDQWLSETNPLF